MELQASNIRTLTDQLAELKQTNQARLSQVEALQSHNASLESQLKNILSTIKQQIEDKQQAYIMNYSSIINNRCEGHQSHLDALEQKLDRLFRQENRKLSQQSGDLNQDLEYYRQKCK